MSLSLVLKAMARLPGFSSKLHAPVVRASLRVAEDPSDGGLSERAPWPFPSASRPRVSEVSRDRPESSLGVSTALDREHFGHFSVAPPKSLSSWAYS